MTDSEIVDWLQANCEKVRIYSDATCDLTYLVNNGFAVDVIYGKDLRSAVIYAATQLESE